MTKHTILILIDPTQLDEGYTLFEAVQNHLWEWEQETYALFQPNLQVTYHSLSHMLETEKLPYAIMHPSYDLIHGCKWLNRPDGISDWEWETTIGDIIAQVPDMVLVKGRIEV